MSRLKNVFIANWNLSRISTTSSCAKISSLSFSSGSHFYQISANGLPQKFLTKPLGSISKGSQSNWVINRRQFYNEAITKEYVARAKYGGRYMVTVLPGDGIGPEMVTYVRQLFKAGGFPVDFEEVILDSYHEDPETMNEAITSILRNGAAIKGNIETREHSKYFLSRNVELRLRLNLFVNIVHCKSHPGICTRHKDIDIVLIRQNTEGEYSCLEHESVNGVVESLKIVTREKTEQVARYAFDYARSNERKKLTCVHKANIMKLADGLFLKICTEIAKEYPDIEFNNMIIDNCSILYLILINLTYCFSQISTVIF
ncbi:hypothetical protein SSS_09209 [Sarcoptes scabiei]|nr:hypothetical protein SSS_09209 [Sarcoptes scabiei]